jgi:hypothetical protein
MITKKRKMLAERSHAAGEQLKYLWLVIYAARNAHELENALCKFVSEARVRLECRLLREEDI